MSEKSLWLSIVVPVYNEQAGLAVFHQALQAELAKLAPAYEVEIIYCDDGSRDNTAALIKQWAAGDQNIKLLSLARNFGKEIATTAGLKAAKGQAVITIDADGQHPVELVGRLIKEWQDGHKVVIGLRTANQREGLVKRWGSRWFYRLFNRLTGLKLVAGATDFRLIDQAVQHDFNQLTEHNRINRGLIDWLGYERTYIEFKAKPRLHGEPAYSFRKLCKLAIDSAISLSSSPLYVTAYIGLVILPLASLLGAAMVINWLAGDPLHWYATGGAYVMVLILFLVGILMMSQGVIGLYLSHIHSETQNRPLYIINKEASQNL